MINKNISELLKAIGTHAQKLKIKTWIVGGCVRDFYLNKNTKDIDITAEADPKALVAFCIKKWGGKAESFGNFGTYRVHLANNIKLDFVRCRSEVYPAPAALPIVSPATIKEDTYRRDFSANAWALSILPANFKESFDLYGAQKDIDKKQIRILHAKSFIDDPTRIFRALRFAGRLGWKLESTTEKLLKEAVKKDYPALLSKERIRQELIKILQETEVKKIFTLLKKYDVLKYIYPGLKWHSALEKTRDLNTRLGILVLSLKDEGPYLLEDLRLARAVTQQIATVLEVYKNQTAPLKELDKTQKNILFLTNPKLPKTAARAPLVSGGEIAAFGYSGKEISNLQKDLRKKQYTGKTKTKKQMLNLIKKCKK